MRRWCCHQSISIALSLWKNFPTFSSSLSCTLPPLPLSISPQKFNRLLQECCNSRTLNPGKQVHQQIIVNGFQRNAHLKTKLLEFYATCDDIQCAGLLFDEMLHRNVFAWTAMLGFYMRNAMYLEVIGTYRRMKIEGVYGDDYVFPKVLKACAELLDLDEGIRVHQDMGKLGLRCNVHSLNALIEMYMRCGRVESARQIFDEMPQRDLLSWNCMIAGYVYNYMYNVALELFDLMQKSGFQPDLITWNTVLSGYCQCGVLEKALDIFNQIKETRYTMPNHVTWTTLIVGYSRKGCYTRALELFKEMLVTNIQPDIDTLSSVLSACKNSYAFRTGQEVHGYGIKMHIGIKFYNSVGGALVTLYSGCGRIADARNVFSNMDKTDVVSWNCMIMGLLQSGNGDSALELLQYMQLEGIKPDQFTITTLLQICSGHASLRHGKEVHAYVIKNHHDLATAVCNALIHMYAKFGCVNLAYAVFQSIEEKDVISWNVIIGGYGINGHGRSALYLFKQMKESGMEPNHVTFTSVLSACSYSGLVDEGKQCFSSMTDESKITPSMEQYACMVDLFGRSGRLEEAMDLINGMPLEPDGSVWGSLLAGCRVHQNVGLAEIVAKQLFHLEPDNAGNYVTLANIYVRAGRWDDAVSVRKMMERRGLMKPHGFSLVEAETT